MSGAILPVIGGVGGLLLGGGLGGVVRGAVLGAAAYNMFFGSKGQSQSNTVRLPNQTGPRLANLRSQYSSYGEVIPQVYGTMRLGGNIIWATDIKETASERNQVFMQSGGSATQTTITYSYSVTLAIAICCGVVDEIIRIWADSKLLTMEMLGGEAGKFNVHLGTNDQLPDDIIAKYKGHNNFPAYRDLCYVVIEDFPLEQFGNRIPSFSFEVKRIVRQIPALEDKIKDIILIPGSGEFVYANEVHYSGQTNEYTEGVYRKKSLNMHNFQGKANLLVALDQMQKTLPNLEWVGLVVTWFATSINAGDCLIVPKAEFHTGDEFVTHPANWQVAGLDRNSAEVVLRFDVNTPTYGGTPSDHTVIQICEELRKRGINIMFYPMIFVDVLKPDPKPWRGRIKSQSKEDIVNWFNGKDGYNKFIMHYAKLIGDKIDAFVIASEMIGLTEFTDKPGSYPSVDQYILLAQMVKKSLDSNIPVIYAADWSEYHHTNDGWYNLDKLWASEAIDIIGIDAYFPLTEDLPESQITPELITKGWESGEGWDYYYDHERTQKHQFNDAKYAWKNLEYWWSNIHINPDNNQTPWQPKMKPVWFTEFGFPSVDGAANQPNVFYDPNSIESFFPRGSKGHVNFRSQRIALNTTLEYLESRCRKMGLEQLIPRRFLWTWDARPFPAWPDYMQVWQDGNLWKTGHWVNGKLGRSDLGTIVAEILISVGFREEDYDVTRLTDIVDGYIIAQHITAREALEQLQSAYFFDVCDSDGILKFVPRMNRLSVLEVNEADLVPHNQKDQVETLSIVIAQELELPQKISVNYISYLQNYDQASIDAKRQTVKTVEQVNIHLPILLQSEEAKKIADVTLFNAWLERKTYSLTLPPKYAYLEPTDVITVSVNNMTYQMRITKTDMQRCGTIQIAATNYNGEIYDFYSKAEYLQPSYEVPQLTHTTILQLIDAPPMPSDPSTDKGIMRFALIPTGQEINYSWKGAAIYQDLYGNNDYKLIAASNNASVVGFALDVLPISNSNLIDKNSKIKVELLHGSLHSTDELGFLNGTNTALIGDELIQFQNAQLIDENQYLLSNFIRGKSGTEEFISTHKKGDRFVLLDSSILTGVANLNLLGRDISYKPVSIGSTLAATESVALKYVGRNLKPFAPVHLKATPEENDNINISWVRRARYNNDWRDFTEIPIGEESEKYQIDIIHENIVIETLETIAPTAIYSNTKKLKNLTFIVYQMSAIVGRGYGTTVIYNSN